MQSSHLLFTFCRIAWGKDLLLHLSSRITPTRVCLSIAFVIDDEDPFFSPFPLPPPLEATTLPIKYLLTMEEIFFPSTYTVCFSSTFFVFVIPEIVYYPLALPTSLGNVLNTVHLDFFSSFLLTLCDELWHKDRISNRLGTLISNRPQSGGIPTSSRA